MRLVAMTSVLALALGTAACTDEAPSEDRAEQESTTLSAEEFCTELEAAEGREKFTDFQKGIAAIGESGVSRDVPSEVRDGFTLYSEMASIAFEKRALAHLENDVTELEGLQLAAYHEWIHEECGLPLVKPAEDDPIPEPAG